MSLNTGKKRAHPSSGESSDPTREPTTRDRKKAKHDPGTPEYDAAASESDENGGYYEPWISGPIERTRPPANRADDDKEFQLRIQRGRKQFSSRVQRPDMQEESQPLDLDAIKFMPSPPKHFSASQNKPEAVQGHEKLVSN
ncbi:hypothetical protein M408DRAFT_28818 [Serendipita vermifera MAFF 305830]|uniref:Uncharacterized protein n=1 Tax=Serendipita vermifera MAFF 305830 TaxID=933852 RepID=A0A0C2W747_SERVB|nr:hypothetical protein M408DRAFT_28818 [Serendipita vermifera MAFF 305830]